MEGLSQFKKETMSHFVDIKSQLSSITAIVRELCSEKKAFVEDPDLAFMEKTEEIETMNDYISLNENELGVSISTDECLSYDQQQHFEESNCENLFVKNEESQRILSCANGQRFNDSTNVEIYSNPWEQRFILTTQIISKIERQERFSSNDAVDETIWCKDKIENRASRISSEMTNSSLIRRNEGLGYVSEGRAGSIDIAETYLAIPQPIQGHGENMNSNYTVDKAVLFLFDPGGNSSLLRIENLGNFHCSIFRWSADTSLMVSSEFVNVNVQSSISHGSDEMFLIESDLVGLALRLRFCADLLSIGNANVTIRDMNITKVEVPSDYCLSLVEPMYCRPFVHNVIKVTLEELIMFLFDQCGLGVVLCLDSTENGKFGLNKVFMSPFVCVRRDLDLRMDGNEFISSNDYTQSVKHQKIYLFSNGQLIFDPGGWCVWNFSRRGVLNSNGILLRVVCLLQSFKLFGVQGAFTEIHQLNDMAIIKETMAHLVSYKTLISCSREFDFGDEKEANFCSLFRHGSNLVTVACEISTLILHVNLDHNIASFNIAVCEYHLLSNDSDGAKLSARIFSRERGLTSIVRSLLIRNMCKQSCVGEAKTLSYLSYEAYDIVSIKFHGLNIILESNTLKVRGADKLIKEAKMAYQLKRTIIDESTVASRINFHHIHSGNWYNSQPSHVLQNFMSLDSYSLDIANASYQGVRYGIRNNGLVLLMRTITVVGFEKLIYALVTPSSYHAHPKQANGSCFIINAGFAAQVILVYCFQKVAEIDKMIAASGAQVSANHNSHVKDTISCIFGGMFEFFHCSTIGYDIYGVANILYNVGKEITAAIEAKQASAQEAKAVQLISKESNDLVEMKHLNGLANALLKVTEPETKLEHQFNVSFLMSLGDVFVHILENFVWDPGLRFILEDKDVLKGNGLSRIKATD